MVSRSFSRTTSTTAGLVSLVAINLGMILPGISEVSFAPLFLSMAGEHAPKMFNAQMMATAGLTLFFWGEPVGVYGTAPHEHE